MHFIKLMCCASLCCTTFAQDIRGVIQGRVRDPRGGSVAGAEIILTDNSTGATRLFRTESDGTFAFPALAPRSYDLSASADGFKKLTASSIVLTADQVREINIDLEVGGLTEAVTVRADVLLLDTDSATVGPVVQGKLVSDLPLNGRNFLQLATLVPGSVPSGPLTNEAARAGRANATVHIAGARAGNSSYLIDGQEARGARFGELAMLPPPDVIAEFKVQQNLYSAQYGTNAGILSIVTKSGSNQFHGALYEYLRSDAFDARQHFDGEKPAAFRLNQFGLVVTGPVWKDRTFFMAGYEGKRQTRAETRLATVPLPALLTGDFSSLLSSTTPTVIRDPFAGGQPFPGNVIPRERISQFALKYNEFIPAPNYTGPTANYQGSPPQRDNADQTHLRLDQQTPGGSLFLRYGQSRSDINADGLLPYTGSSFPLNGMVAAVNHTWAPNASTVNVLHLGYTRNYLRSNNQTSPTNLQSTLGLVETNVRPDEYSLPRVTIPGYSVFGHSQNTSQTWTNLYTVNESIALVKGPHRFSAGMEVRHQRLPGTVTNVSNGRLTFGGDFTGNGLADYLLGIFTSALKASSARVYDHRNTAYSAFTQWDASVSRTLSLNLGLRWEYHSPVREMGGAEGLFDPAAGVLRVTRPPSAFGAVPELPGVVIGEVPDGVVSPRRLDFAPRIGLAWRVAEKTVVRTGAGVFYLQNQFNDASAVAANPGAFTLFATRNTGGSIPQTTASLFNSRTAMTVLDLTVADPARQTPRLTQFNANIQRQISALAVEVGYLGSLGRHLMGREELNQARLNQPGQSIPLQMRRPYPQFGSVLLFSGNENSNYNAMTVRITGRVKDALTLLGGYTWAKSLDGYSSSIEDSNSSHPISNNRRVDYGLSSFDVRHRVAFGATYDLPFGPGKQLFRDVSGLAAHLLNGWQTNTIVQWQTGAPFTVVWRTDRSATGIVAAQRPNRVADGNLPRSERTPSRWFDSAAFTPNPLGTHGNSGRNILWADDINTVDLSLFKDFVITEKLRLQFRAEAFNLLNNDNFFRPEPAIDGPNFGRVTSVGPAREIQFALKLLW